MKLLIVTQCFAPDIYAVNDLVRRLVQRGHRVTVLTGLPDYTTGRIPREYRWFRRRREVYEGAQVCRVPTIARRTGPVWRSLNYLSFAVSGWLAASFLRWRDFDAIYVWQVSPVTMAIPAIRLKQRYHKPLFLYCMDLWPESVKAMGFQEGGLLFGTVARLSRWIYRRCDLVAVSSEPFREYLVRTAGLDAGRIPLLYQYAPMPETLPVKVPNGHIDFLFIGNVGKVQQVDLLLRACARLARGGWTLHIVGGGSELERCKALARKLGLGDAVRFHGSCPPEQTDGFYRRADACLLALRGGDMIGQTLPGKLQTYLAAGKPVLAAIDGAGRQVIEKSGCGRCVPAGDEAGFAALLADFVRCPQDFADCGRRGRAYFEQEFTAERHLSRLEQMLGALREEGKKTP